MRVMRYSRPRLSHLLLFREFLHYNQFLKFYKEYSRASFFPAENNFFSCFEKNSNLFLQALRLCIFGFCFFVFCFCFVTLSRFFVKELKDSYDECKRGSARK